MPEREPQFEVPEPANRMSEEDLDQLLPKPNNPDNEPILVMVRSEYIAKAAVKTRPHRPPSQKRTQSPRK